jgi:hypothetical protein
MTAVKEPQAQPVTARFAQLDKIPTWLAILVIGGAMPLVYWLGLALPYPLDFGLMNPRATWVKAGEGSLTALAWQIGVYLLLTLLYVAALRLFAGRATLLPQRTQIRSIVLIWALCACTLLFVAPNGESHDIYDYLFRGRMMDRFGVSPLAVTPNAYPNEPFYRYVAWKKHVDTYGPLWEYTSAATAKTVRIVLTAIGSFWPQLDCPRSLVGCQTLAGYITGYRLLALLLTGLSALLLQSIVRQINPTAVPLALVIWLWNPLLLMATAVGAHNDAVMLFFFFLTFWCWQRGHWLLGWLAFGLATQVKLTALLLTPVLGLWLVRKLGWLRALAVSFGAAAIMVGVSWLLYEPLGGWSTLPRMLYERQLFVSHSWAQILYFLLYKWSGWPYSLVQPLLVAWPTWLFFAPAALLLLRPFLSTALTTTHNQNDLYRSCALLMLLYLLVGSFWFQAWYVVWLLAPAVLWVDGRFPQQGLPWLCWGALCSNVVYDHFTQLPMAAEPDAHLYRLGVTLLVVLTIWLPLFIAQGMGMRKRLIPQEIER